MNSFNWPLLLGVFLVASPVVVRDCADGLNRDQTCYNVCQLKVKGKTIHKVDYLAEEAGERHVCACYTERVVVSFRDGEDRKANKPEKE